MQAYLRVVSGPDAGRTFDLIEGIKLTIGRGEKSDTRLTDCTVSRLHCELKWENGKFQLVDLDSVGGTLVDGKKIKERDLKHDQEFQIGGTRLKLHTTGIPDAQTLVAAQKPARELKPDEGVLTGKTISHYELGASDRQGPHRHGLQGPRLRATARTSPSRCCIPTSPATRRTSSGSSAP